MAFRSQKKAYIFAITAVVLWSTVATAFKLTLKWLSFIDMLFWASLTSTLYLAVMVLISENHSALKATRNPFEKSIIMGFLNPFLYYLVLFKAYSLLPAQIAQPLNYTWPITLVVIGAIFLHRPLHLRGILALLISFLGVVVISGAFNSGESQHFSTAGIILAIGSAFIWAFYWVFTLSDGRPPDVRLFMNFAVGTIFVAVLAFSLSSPLTSPWQGIVGSIYIGIFEMGATFFVWLKALEYAEDQAPVANLIYLSPFISLIFIHLVLGERILATTVVGLLLILLGIIVQKK